MKIKTSETTPIQINWLVAKCEGWEPGKYMMSTDIRKDVNGKVIGIMVPNNREYVWFKPSTDWGHGGPIIEREEIFLAKSILGGWTASIYYAAPDDEEYPRPRCTLHGGETPLIAAMRCYVASRLGDEVDVPDELVNTEE